MGRSQIKKGTATVKESRVLNEDKAKISEVLIPLLPQLLHRVGASFFLFVVVRVPSYSLVSFCLKKQLLMLHMFFFFSSVRMFYNVSGILQSHPPCEVLCLVVKRR